MREIRFVVVGEARAKGRPRFANGIAYTDKKTVAYENLVKMYASEAIAGKDQLQPPIIANINVSYQLPKSKSPKKNWHKTSRPDLDNICKAILDSCNKIIFNDDSEVISLSIRKFYGEKSEVEVIFSGS